MTPPIRTNLDQRMNVLKEAMDDFFESITKEYTHAIESIKNPKDIPIKKVLKLRERAQSQAQYLSQELLLVLTLNQPLLQDLRVIAAYLRGIDVIERLARHARDVSLTMAEWSDLNTPGEDEPLREGLTALGKTVDGLIAMLRVCLIDQREIDPVAVTESWASIQTQYRENSQSILEAEKDAAGGRSGRMLLSTVASRFERSGYNLIRLAGLWHYALENEWVHYEH
tara:strand:- start:1208 stop:1885 length:678 start_codon:yes stop_codon:yes gene_type:complete